MRTRTCATLAIAALAVLCACASALAEPREPGRAPAAYIVVFHGDVGDADGKTARLERARGFRARFRYARALKGFAARLTDRQADELRADPDVAFVAPDRTVRASAPVPLAGGDTAPPGVRRIEAATTAAARQAATGNVAVIDTGIDLAHPGLNAVSGRNCLGTGTAQDDEGHGTHVAGTIGARNDGAGVVGVAPATRLHAVKVLDSAGEGTFSQIVCGIDWVTATRLDTDPGNDIAVANMSLGGGGDPIRSCATTTDPMHKAICGSTAAGVTYVVAAGNESWDFDFAQVPDVPAAYPQVLTVTAMADTDGRPGALGAKPGCRGGEADDRYASFSSYALTAAGRAHTIAAPGVCIRSTLRGGGYGQMSGTSMATPHVAGLAALCFGEAGAAGPCAGMTPAQAIAQLLAEAERWTASTTANGYTGDPLRPFGSRYFGYVAHILAASAPPPPPPAFSGTPTSTLILAGAARSGSAAQLGTDDDSYYEVGSTGATTRAAAWYGTVEAVPNALTSLSATYRGRNSAACSQTVSLWRWTTSSWVVLDTRSVGPAEVQVDRPATGTPADYVSGTTGDGQVRVRVRCTSGTSAFHTSGDLMRVSWTR